HALEAGDWKVIRGAHLDQKFAGIDLHRIVGMREPVDEALPNGSGEPGFVGALGHRLLDAIRGGTGGKVWGDYLDDSSLGDGVSRAQHHLSGSRRITHEGRVRFEPVLASVLRCHPENCKLCPWAGWASSA